jgi:hypothetical protein
MIRLWARTATAWTPVPDTGLGPRREPAMDRAHAAVAIGSSRQDR